MRMKKNNHSKNDDINMFYQIKMQQKLFVVMLIYGLVGLLGVFTFINLDEFNIDIPFVFIAFVILYVTLLWACISLYRTINNHYFKPLDHVLELMTSYRSQSETTEVQLTNSQEYLELALQRFQISQEVPLIFIGLKVVGPDVIVISMQNTAKPLTAIQLSNQMSFLELFDMNTGWNLVNRLSESAKYMLPVHFEAKLKNLDFYYCDIQLQPVKVVDGVIWQGVISDATDNKLYQLALAEEKKFIEELFQASRALFCVVDLNLRLIRYNQIFVEKLLLNQEDTLKLEFWKQLLLGNEFEEFNKKIQSTVAQRTISHMNSTLTLTSGKRLLIEWSFVAIEMDEQAVIMITGNDVTEHAFLNNELHHINESLMAKNKEVENIMHKQEQLFSLFEQIRFTGTADDLFHVLIKGLKMILPFRNLFLFIKADKFATDFEVFDARGEFSETQKQTYFVEYKGILGQVIQSATDFYSGAITENEKYIEHHEGINSLLLVPIRHQDFLWGVIGADSETKNAFSAIEIEMFKLSAAHIGLYLEEYNSRKELTEEAKKLKGLHHTVSEMMYQRDRSHIAQRVVDEGLYGHLAIYGSTTTGIRLLSETRKNSHEQFGVEHSMALIEQSIESGSYSQTYFKSQQLYHCSQPINHGEANFGVIYGIKERGLTTQEREVMAIIAKQLAVIWRLNDLMEVTEWEALIDPLTEIWNRRFIIRRIEEEHLKMLNSETTAAMIMIDLSEFKSVNDTYGHEIGDEVLKSVAQIFKDCLKPTDAIGRFGGDEFIILLPEADRLAAQDCVNLMERQLYKAPLTVKQLRIQADFGIVCVPEDTDSLMTALKIADLNMYHSKGTSKVMQK